VIAYNLIRLSNILARHGGGMSHQWPKGVLKRRHSCRQNSPNSVKSGCLSA
jgi:hypothetical protein